MTSQISTKLKAENSLSVRLASLVLSLLSISLACHYAKVPRIVSFLYIFTCLFGSFCAYYFRKKENRWLIAIAIVGTILVMGNFAQEVFFQFYVGKLNPIGPFVSVLAGLLSLHTLDLRTRVDINTAGLIGLGLMACIGMIAHDITFGASVVAYLILGAVLLYFQCISSTIAGVTKRTRDLVDPVFGLPARNLRKTVGSSVLAVMSLPVFALILFLNLPRIDSLVDRLVVELAEHGFPFNVLVVGTPDAVGGGSGAGPGTGPGLAPGNSAGNGTGVPGGTGPLTGNGANSQINTSLTPSRSGSGSGYGLAPSIGKSGPFDKQPIPESETQYKHIDPAKDAEMRLRLPNKKATAEDDTILLTMTSSREVFLKRLVFNTFDGHRWKAKDNQLLVTVDLAPETLASLADVPCLVRPIGGSIDVSQEITIRSELGHIIPAATTPQQIQFPAEQIFVDRFGCLRSPVDLTAGMKFQVISKTPFFNAKHLNLNSPTPDEEASIQKLLKDDLQMPKDLGVEVHYLAKAIVGSEKNWFNQADRICRYLRSNFAYSLDALEPPPSEDLVKHFLLTSKKGDCTYFASAFIMLCRSLGIPARCVGGFAPGSRNLVSGLTEIRWRNSHAWAEVFIPRFGWIPFDSVPGGYLPEERPQETILSSLKDTELARSFARAVESVAKAKGLHRPDEEEEIASAQKSHNQQQPTRKGQTDTSAPPQVPGIVSNRLEENSNSGKPLLRIDGVAVSRSQASKDSYFPNIYHVWDWLTKFDLTSFTTYWQTIALVTVLITVSVIVFQILRQNFHLFAGKRISDRQAAPKYSTLAFMRVMKDLARVKVQREKGDTAKEVFEKVIERLAEIEKPVWRETLPGLLGNFIELYYLTRFTETESATLTAKLQDVEKQIHAILTSG